MSDRGHRTPGSRRRSLLFQDLASPVSVHRGKFSSPGQATAISALWRENFGGLDLPPPPVNTLEDRLAFSPETGIAHFSASFEGKSDSKHHLQQFSGGGFSTPAKDKSEASTSSARPGSQQKVLEWSSSSLWSIPQLSSSERGSTEKASPRDNGIQPVASVMFPPPKEVARPEMQTSSLNVKAFDEEEWVTVYGFSPGDTNLVVREFEKCGVILKHLAGPREANWMHILYQSRSDVRRALTKNGTLISGVLMIGVKPVDPVQQQELTKRLNQQSFMPLSHSSTTTFEPAPYARSYHIHNGGSPNVRQPGAAIATPKKSLASKLMDLIIGI